MWFIVVVWGVETKHSLFGMVVLGYMHRKDAKKKLQKKTPINAFLSILASVLRCSEGLGMLEHPLSK